LNALVENAIIIALQARLTRPEAKSAVTMTDEEERTLREQLSRLQQEHRDLDAAIAALAGAPPPAAPPGPPPAPPAALAISPGSDLIQVQRLKKRKLVLRDKIRRIEDVLTPDIIA
jgi:hypothetical protein